MIQQNVGVKVFMTLLSICLLSGVAVAQGRPERMQPQIGPYPLPNLPALPLRNDHGFYADQEVAHGTVEQATYQDVNGKEKRLHVYLPPGYSDSQATYPVLYLNHGGGDDDSAWSAAKPNGGHVPAILDNLIAAGKAKPMIVVMPNTRGLAKFQPPKAGEIDDCSREFAECIIPHVDKNYRTRPDRNSRALAGLSMGGFVVLHAGLTNLDTFGELYVYSSGYIQDDARQQAEVSFESLLSAQDANKRLNVPLYFAAGETDIALNNCLKTMAIFNKNGIRTFWVLSDGGHDWNNWRRYLWQTAQVMFPGTEAAKQDAANGANASTAKNEAKPTAMDLYDRAEALIKESKYEEGYQAAKDAMKQFNAEGDDLAWMKLESINVDDKRIDVHFNMGPAERKLPDNGIVRPLSFRIWSTTKPAKLLQTLDFELGRRDGETKTAAIGEMIDGGHANYGIMEPDSSYEAIRNRIIEFVKSK